MRRIQVLLAGVLVASFVVATLGSVRGRVSQDQEEAARMAQGMRTVCVGRVLIDLPREAQIEIPHARVDGFDITTYTESTDSFFRRLEAREAQLRSTPTRHGANVHLEIAREVRTTDGLAGKIFVHGRAVFEGTRANGLELERYRSEGVDLEALVHANGTTFSLVATNDLPSALENLSRLVTQLVPNAGNWIPTEPGYCIDRAFVRDPLTAEQRERVTLVARLPDHPDVSIEMGLAAGIAPDQHGLLERSASSFQKQLARSGRVSRLRAGRRTIGGMMGDELVRRFVEPNDAVVHNLWWEVNGTGHDVLLPQVNLMMNTGVGANGPVPSSLSQDAVIALWDAITSSVRLRPVSPEVPGVKANTRLRP